MAKRIKTKKRGPVASLGGVISGIFGRAGLRKKAEKKAVPEAVPENVPAKTPVKKEHKRKRRGKVKPPKGKLVSLLKPMFSKKAKEGAVPKEEAKPKAIEVPMIYTKADKIVEIVNKRREVSISQLQRKLRIDRKNLMEWAKILDEQKMVILHYPQNPMSPPLLRSIDYKKKKGEAK